MFECTWFSVTTSPSRLRFSGPRVRSRIWQPGPLAAGVTIVENVVSVRFVTAPVASVSVPVIQPFATSWPALLSAKPVIVATPERALPVFVVPATGVVNEVAGSAAVAVPAVRASTATSAASAPVRANLIRTRGLLICGQPSTRDRFSTC
jgi:hypothetical protein